MNQPPKNNVVYYFEIPVGVGEFAIGAVDGKTAGAYLMYLDLGTNGESGETSSNVTSFENIDYRSYDETSSYCPLIITYETENKNFDVEVNYSNNSYYINLTGDTGSIIKITILDTNYTYYFNNTPIPSVIGSVERGI